MKNNIFGEEEPVLNDLFKKDYNPAKFNDIMDSLQNLYNDKILKELANSNVSQEISKLSETFILELEVFFSTNERI